MSYNNSNTDEMIKNVVIYTRVSSAEQVEGFSLETQVEDLEKFIAYKGYTLLEKFQDRGISAKDIENRDDYKKMMKYIKTNAKGPNKVDAIIVWKLSRFSRNSLDLQQALQELEQLNCHLIAEKDGLNTFNDMNKVILKLLGIFAELERTNIANNVRSGMKKGAQEGNWMGGVAPYGYKNVPKTSPDGSTLEINDQEAAILRKIFKLYADNNGYAKIADILNNKLMVKTRRNNYWTFNTISQILDNPVYIGMIQYGKHTDWNRKGRSGKNKPEAIMIVKGKHEALIDMETWEKVRAIRDERGFKPVKTRKAEHLLSGKILCPSCNTPMVSNVVSKKRDDGSVRNNYYYQCGRYNNTKACKPNLVKKEVVDEQVKKLLFEFSRSSELQNLVLDRMNKSLNYNEQTDIIDRSAKELKSIESKIDNAYEILLEEDSKNIISKEKIKEKISLLEEKKQNLKQNIAQAEDRILVIKNDGNIAKDISFMLSNLESFFDKASIEKQKQVMDYLIKYITVHNDPDINKRSMINKIILQFSSEEIEKINFDTRNNVWFTCDMVPREVSETPDTPAQAAPPSSADAETSSWKTTAQN